MVLAVALISFLTLPKHPLPPEPKWLDDQIAGYMFDQGSSIVVYDKARGFFVKRSFECDGAISILELTRDRREALGISGGEFDWRDVFYRGLRNLSTRKGIKIGDNPNGVREILGKPTKVRSSGDHVQYLDYEYDWVPHPKDQYPEHIGALYTFKRGKLIQIVFSRDSSG
jgi:hypothetical protein